MILVEEYHVLTKLLLQPLDILGVSEYILIASKYGNRDLDSLEVVIRRVDLTIVLLVNFFAVVVESLEHLGLVIDQLAVVDVSTNSRPGRNVGRARLDGSNVVDVTAVTQRQADDEVAELAV